jgi:thiamine biosynthesis lipoprotein
MIGQTRRGSFPAMSTTVEITGVGISDREMARALALGRHLANAWEDRFSRFRPGSQLCRLNAAAGESVRVDGLFLDLLERVKGAVPRTAGRFDPSILPALEAAGYDRSFAEGLGTPRPLAIEAPHAAGTAGWARVRIDRQRSEARLPAGMRIDLGGVAKGAFADLLAAELFHAWPGGCVDAGGDLRAWGAPPDGERWVVGLEDPFHPDVDQFVAELSPPGRAAMATSATHRRRWRAGEEMAHHLIDPRTGLPLPDIARAVTAFAPDVATAEIATKALMVAAADGALPETFGAPLAVVTYADGQIAVIHEGTSDVDLFAPDRACYRPA